jgi:uncharacterized membrane protein YeaQ/YmgE (transglycosylase-associated protein family)
VIGAIILGLVAGAVARLLMPGDEDVFDLGGIVGAIVGTLVVLPAATFLLRRLVGPRA